MADIAIGVYSYPISSFFFTPQIPIYAGNPFKRFRLHLLEAHFDSPIRR